jgi:hypothetical protein
MTDDPTPETTTTETTTEDVHLEGETIVRTPDGTVIATGDPEPAAEPDDPDAEPDPKPAFPR